MPSLRIGTFNVENLFERARVFVDAPDMPIAAGLLGMIDELRGLLGEATYTVAIKKDILELYHGDRLKDYISVREDRGKFWRHSGHAIVGVAATGADDWDGSIEFKRAAFSDLARENTAAVIRALKADLLCMVEAEDRPTLRAFDAHLLGSRYRYEMLIDSNDPRGIDVGLYSKHPFGEIRTHMFDTVGTAQVFSRDCLEIEVEVTDVGPIYFLLNHFKSKGYDYDGTAARKRERQANHVREILGRYKLTEQRVVVCGDFNDTPDSPALAPLLGTNALYDVLALQFGADVSRRWTYHFETFDQIDFLLVSRPLRDAFKEAGVIRQGIHGLRALTSALNSGVPEEREYETVTSFSNQASDHGAVWATFEL